MKTYAVTAAPTRQATKAFHYELWALQIFLALVFAIVGIEKLAASPADLLKVMPWTANVPDWLVTFIGTAELAGALGLILPSVTRIVPGLTPAAAVGLVTMMGLAAPFHLERGEPAGVFITVLLGCLAALVGWGRYSVAPISPRRHV